jgi:hypothetical protein
MVLGAVSVFCFFASGVAGFAVVVLFLASSLEVRATGLRRLCFFSARGGGGGPTSSSSASSCSSSDGSGVFFGFEANWKKIISILSKTFSPLNHLKTIEMC